MGKQYYCDYCQRSFADGAENRKKHLISLSHQKLRKLHYEQFKDAAAVLEESRLKKPCHKYNSTGYCEFESRCKYSHLTPLDLQALEERVHQEKLLTTASHLKEVPDIEEWLQRKISKIENSKECKPSKSAQQVVLPPALSNIQVVPPSLIPATPSEFINTKNKNQWG